MPYGNTDVFVLYAARGEADIGTPLYPPERYREVMTCKNEKAGREKYLVWKLLEKATRECLNLDFDNIKFTKKPNGQWVCPDFYFSLSHADGALCVAVSDAPVGVDIEKIRILKDGIAKRFLTERELERWRLLPEDERCDFLLRSWVKKESDFKMRGGVSLMPVSAETLDSDVFISELVILGEKYLLSVSTESENKMIEIRFTEEI